jgi:putative ABC transport system substrate-binding protein
MVAKNLKFMIMVILTLLLFAGCGKKESGKEKSIKIGISQIIEHPALDAARKGFEDVLGESEFKEKLNIETQSAQGDMSIAQNIAKSFVEDKKDLILAIATPTAQAAYNATKEIPILITAVTDPKAAGLVEGYENTGTNVAGTSDASPMDKQMDLMKALLPTVKKVGVIYNTSEQNSEIQVVQWEKLCKENGIQLEKVGITNINEMASALDSLLDKVDVLYTPTDNLVVSSMPLIISKSMEKKVPVIGSEKAHVESGALATEGIDYYKLGRQTGEMAVEFFRGKEISELGIHTLENTQLVINIDTAKKLGIDIPESLKREDVILIGGN